MELIIIILVFASMVTFAAWASDEAHYMVPIVTISVLAIICISWLSFTERPIEYMDIRTATEQGGEVIHFYEKGDGTLVVVESMYDINEIQIEVKLPRKGGLLVPSYKIIQK